MGTNDYMTPSGPEQIIRTTAELVGASVGRALESLNSVEALFGRPLARVVGEPLEDAAVNAGSIVQWLDRLSGDHNEAIQTLIRELEDAHRRSLDLSGHLATAIVEALKRAKKSGRPSPEWCPLAQQVIDDNLAWHERWYPA